MKPATLVIAIALAVPAGCWRSQEVASGADTDTEDTESGGMTDPDTGTETDISGQWFWEEMLIPIYAHELTGVWGHSSDDVFAVGNGGTILHYDGNDELEWASVQLPEGIPPIDLGDVSGVTGVVATAVGAGGAILSAVHGGSWTAVQLPHEWAPNLRAVCHESADVIWAVGQSGTAFRLPGPQLDVSPQYDLMSVTCPSGGGAYAVGHINSAGMSTAVIRMYGTAPSPWYVDHETGHFAYACAAWGEDLLVALMQQQSSQEDLHARLSRYDGSQWDDQGTVGALILGLHVDSEDRRWAVGYIFEGDTFLSNSVIFAGEPGSPDMIKMYMDGDSATSLNAVWSAPDTGEVFAVGGGPFGEILRGKKVEQQ